jgi:hypothetical protein
MFVPGLTATPFGELPTFKVLTTRSVLPETPLQFTTDMVLESLFETYIVLVLGLIATFRGCAPVFAIECVEQMSIMGGA